MIVQMMMMLRMTMLMMIMMLLTTTMLMKITRKSLLSIEVLGLDQTCSDTIILQ